MNELLLQKAREKGGDDDFQAYVRLFPSVLTNDYAEWVNGEGRSVYAHVRRVSAGAGIAHKPPYSGVPLTQAQHANTHQGGESHYNNPEWWERKATEMLTNWINGVKPPVLPEKRTKETYIIESANHMNAFKEMLTPYFLNPKAKPVEITIQTGKKRSTKQNSAMWGVIYGDILDFYKGNPAALAKDVCEYALSCEPSNAFIHELMKGLCNNGESTAALKVNSHCAYFESVAGRFIEYGHEVKMPINPNDYY